MLPDDTDLGAGFFFGASAAGPEAFGRCALAYFTQGAAEERLSPVHPASFAIDMLRQDSGVVQFRPQLRGLLPKGLVIVFRGDIGIALFRSPARRWQSVGSP